MEKSEKKFLEIPFAIEDKSGIIKGAMDAVFREAGGWVIVDYKTDDFEKDPKRKKVYTQQIELYKKYWEHLTGEKVKETLLVHLSL